MTKQQAIDALNHLIYMIDKDDFQVWHARAMAEFDLIFGKDSIQYEELRRQYHNNWNKEKSYYKALLTTYQGHVNRHWPLNKPKGFSIDPEKVSFTQIFSLINKMPIKYSWAVYAGVAVLLVGAFYFGVLTATLSIDYTKDELREQIKSLREENIRLKSHSRKTSLNKATNH